MKSVPKFEEAAELLAKCFETEIMLEADRRGVPSGSMETDSSSRALFPISVDGVAFWLEVYDKGVAKSVIKGLVSKIENLESLVSILKIVVGYYNRDVRNL